MTSALEQSGFEPVSFAPLGQVVHTGERFNNAEAFQWDEAPRYLIRDRDTSYGAAVTGGCEPWAFATGRSRHARRGRTVMLNG